MEPILSLSYGNPGGVAQTMNYPQAQPIAINIDEPGNILIVINDRPVKSEEGLAFVTVGVDGNGRLAYISIEPEDEELASFISRIKVRL
ncbi:hypothetical protein [Caldivirga sp.]|uniref:hypothetical protein n=1 Tax=Caldivirga sp. TaxID=2080243 RepID=UPI003D116292